MWRCIRRSMAHRPSGSLAVRQNDIFVAVAFLNDAEVAALLRSRP